MAYEVIRTLTVTFSYGAYAGILLVASGRAGEGWGGDLIYTLNTVTSLASRYTVTASLARGARGRAAARGGDRLCWGIGRLCTLKCARPLSSRRRSTLSSQGHAGPNGNDRNNAEESVLCVRARCRSTMARNAATIKMRIYIQLPTVGKLNTHTTLNSRATAARTDRRMSTHELDREVTVSKA